VSFVEGNARELQRLRSLVARLSDDDLGLPVTPEWSVADMLGHIAFWDARASMLGQKLESGVPWSAEDHEGEEVDSLNGAVAVLIKALPPRLVAETAVRLAESTDALVARLPAERMWPQDDGSPLNCERSGHRAEHLDQIEAALPRI
jgi:mycothiol maleylpyruvate isomerase-like protein